MNPKNTFGVHGEIKFLGQVINFCQGLEYKWDQVITLSDNLVVLKYKEN